MFDKYMICEDTVKILESEGQITGYEFGIRLPYYRGLGISMVEDIQLTVDDNPVDSENIEFRLKGKSMSLKDMETDYETVWDMGEVAYLSVNHPGGLTLGKHKIELVESLRISYMPILVKGADEKIVDVV